jgi:hypothetical protein
MPFKTRSAMIGRRRTSRAEWWKPSRPCRGFGVPQRVHVHDADTVSMRRDDVNKKIRLLRPALNEMEARPEPSRERSFCSCGNPMPVRWVLSTDVAGAVKVPHAPGGRQRPEIDREGRRYPAVSAVGQRSRESGAGRVAAPVGDMRHAIFIMADGRILRSVSPGTVRHLLTEHRRAGFPAELNTYLFGLTADEQDVLMAGNDAVWLAKDAPQHRRRVEDRLTAMISGLEQVLAELRTRRSTTNAPEAREDCHDR